MNVVPMTPITIVRLCSNVPLDNTYKDTLTFGSASAQSSFFASKAKFTFNNLTPIRLQNKMRIPKPADDVYDCNYLMFQNANFSNKWFYAFITSIDFINVNMCEIGFELDVMQTWYFDYDLKPSFVQREHVNNDSVGANIVYEGLEIGEYINNGSPSRSGHMNVYAIVVAATTDSKGNDAIGGMQGGVYSGLKYNVFTSASEANNMITYLVSQNKQTAIVDMFMFPNGLIRDDGLPAIVNVVKNKKISGTIDGYTPRNNKLYTYPYNFLYVSCGNGSYAAFKYEYFSGSTCIFYLEASVGGTPQIMLMPSNYKGNAIDFSEKMVLDGFPHCAYTYDAYMAWAAQVGSAPYLETAAYGLSTVTSIASGNLAGGVSGLIGVLNVVNQKQRTEMLPPQAVGSQGQSIGVASGELDFWFYPKSITAEYARIIDDYFDMFGYAVNEVKVPNRTGRPSWNYVKTIDCKCVGSVPFDDMNKIRSIYDNGVTFWHGDYVGDYTRGNSPS